MIIIIIIIIIMTIIITIITTIIIIMITITIQFLLHTHKKNIFIFLTSTVVAFYVTILYPTLQDSIFQQSISSKLFKSSEDH